MDIKELLDKMSLEEKIAQLVQLDGSTYTSETIKTGPDSKIDLAPFIKKNIGSIYNVVGKDNLLKIQNEYLENSKNQIPLLVCADIVYGYKTILPIPLAFSCSWNLELIEKSMSMVGKEAKAAGVHAVFSPVADLVRDPRWGRVLENTGEDTFLSSKIIEAEVKGLQKDLNVFSCVKHFAGYGAVESGKEYNSVDMSEYKFRKDYLPPYISAIKAGSKMVMSSFNTFNGVPVTGNKWLLRDLLRNEYEFNGVIVSDYAAIRELIYHGYATDEEEAARIALEAGIDFDMKTPVYSNYLKTVIDKNPEYEKLINEAVLRILSIKEELGLFENSVRGLDKVENNKLINTIENKEIAKKMADESIVLLKNNGILPLNKNHNIALIGPYADTKSIVGLWAIFSEEKNVTSLKEALYKKENLNINYSKGCGILNGDNIIESSFSVKNEEGYSFDLNSEIEKAIITAKESDIIIYAFGEHVLESGEGASKTNLSIDQTQKELLKKLKELNKPIIGVMYNGRPLVLTDIVDYFDALIEAWFPGSEGSNSIADIIVGKVNPSGKLTMTFPRSMGQIPIYYSVLNTGRPEKGTGHSSRFVSKYLDEKSDPLYEFGFGLSYSNFVYNSININSNKFTEEEVIKVEVSISNLSEYDGKETVQLYIRDLFSKISRPILELKKFKKVQIRSGETVNVEFELDIDDLKYLDSELNLTYDKGEFEIFVGSSSKNIIKEKIELI